MARVLNLTDGTTTHDLIGGTYTARAGTLNLGNPSRQQVESANIFGSRWDLIAHAFTKRVISMGLYITASDIDDLSTAIQNINKAIQDAKGNAMNNVGNPWKLTFNPGGNALNITFRIQNGYLTIPPTAWTVATGMKTANPFIANAVLTLECDPFGEGAQETILNYVGDPSFEVAGTALADWTTSHSGSHTVSSARVTTDAKYGNACLSIAITNSSGGASSGRTQSLTAAATEVWSFGVWHKITAQSGSNGRIRLQVQWKDSGGSVLSTVNSDVTTGVHSDWTQIKLENQTAPSSTATALLGLMGVSDASGGTVTVLYDGVMAVKASALPTAWVSGADLNNHFDDDAQAHLNYIDIHPNLGDIPAAVQVKYSEDQAHTVLWAGARHGTRQYDAGLWHEAEDFDTWASEPSDAATSGGKHGRFIPAIAVDNVSTHVQTYAAGSTITEAHTVADNGNRLLLAAVHAEGSTNLPSGVTWAGSAMTKFNEASFSNTGASLWYIVGGATGTNNCVATFASTPNAVGIGVMSLYGVDQGTPLADSQTQTGGSFVIAQAHTSSTGDLVVGVASLDGLGVSPLTGAAGSGETERYDFEDSGSRVASLMYTEENTGSSVTINITISGGICNFAYVGAVVKGGGAGTAAAPSTVTEVITTPPRGTYRVLVRAKDTTDAWALAMGYTYGGVTVSPSIAAHYTALDTGYYTWLDVGSIVIPPTTLPENSTLGAFSLVLSFYRTSGSGASQLDVDAVMLMPTDGGMNYVSKTSAQDVVVLDSISPQPSLSLWDTSDVFQSRPQQEGSPPYVDPDGTRIYFLVDDGATATITHGGQATVTIRPRYLVVG